MSEVLERVTLRAVRPHRPAGQVAQVLDPHTCPLDVCLLVASRVMQRTVSPSDRLAWPIILRRSDFITKTSKNVYLEPTFKKFILVSAMKLGRRAAQPEELAITTTDSDSDTEIDNATTTTATTNMEDGL